LYATREGQTRRIAEHVAADVRAHGLAADVVDACDLPHGFDLGAYAAAVVAASVHFGKHEREMTAFVKEHRDALARMPAAFLSVSGSEATVERANASPEARARAAHDVREMIARFFEETGWRPDRVHPVAGAIAYTKYNFLLRFVMRRIAKREDAPTDTSRDYEFTDWQALDHFVDELLGALRESQPRA
jgi:menaquinone-dependent protoporphyrinogen oxidase